MALTKVSGPLLHGSNDNLGNYVINNITGAAATFSSVSVGGTLTYDDVTNVDSVGIVTARGGLHVGVGGTIINAMPEDNGSLGIGQSIFHIGDTDTNFGFDSDNQIVFNAGGNEKLKVDSSGNVYFAGNRSGNDRGIIYNDSNGFGIYGSSSGSNHRNIIFFSSSSGSSEKVRITSGGAVAIGTDGAVSETKLDVLGNVVFGPRQHTGNPGANTGIASIRGHLANTVGDFAQLYFSNSESTGGGTGAKALISGTRDGVAGSNYGAGLSFNTEYRDPSVHSPKQRMLISSLGIIGINTSGPTAYFDIATNAGTYDNLRLRRIDSGSSGNSDWSLKPYGGNLFFRLAGATDKIVFTDDGKVGINTGSTSHSLMVYDATESKFRIATTGVLAYDHTFDGSTYTIANNNGSAGIPLIIGTKISGGESLRIDSSGVIGVGHTQPEGKGIDVAHSRTNSYAKNTDTRNLAHIIARNSSDAPGRFAAISLINGGGTQAEGSINLVQTGNYQGDLTFKIRTAVSNWEERLRINASGQVGINTHVHADTASALTIMNGASASEHSILDIRCNDNETSRIYFSEVSTSANGSIRYRYTSDDRYMSFYTNGSSASEERLRITKNGHISIISGNLEFANGSGIDFSNVPDGSRSIDTDGNKLDDYEEGSFTPYYYTQNSLLTAGYVSQDGKYTKIGRFVHFQIYLRLSSKSGGSGHLRIYGLPFSSSDVSGAAYGGGVVAYTNNWDNDAIDRIMIGSGSDQVQLFVGTSSGTNVNAGAGNLNSDTQLRIFGSYQV